MKNQSGVSMLEAMIAAAVIGIGFMAIYTLSITSTKILMSSIDREKGNMIANTIFEDLITDVPNLLAYHNMDFTVAGQGSTSHKIKKKNGQQLLQNILEILNQKIGEILK